MIEHRPVSELGGGDLGWLKALHHFHIGTHGNPIHKAIGNLYVWNDDELAPGTGFPAHPHRDVEIITYVREGYVSHRDSLGHEGRIESGDVQVMSAGTGIEHAEVGAPNQRTKVFQIWLRPRERGGEPRWGTKLFPRSDRADRWVVLASGFPQDTDALMIRADARVLGAALGAGQSLTYELEPGRKAYLVATSGRITLNNLALEARDGAAVRDERELRIEALADTEIVMVDAM
jgi:redox-sensitive bicupin YhaK (pirin superfamily)